MAQVLAGENNNLQLCGPYVAGRDRSPLVIGPTIFSCKDYECDCARVVRFRTSKGIHGRPVGFPARAVAVPERYGIATLFHLNLAESITRVTLKANFVLFDFENT